MRENKHRRRGTDEDRHKRTNYSKVQCDIQHQDVYRMKLLMCRNCKYQTNNNCSKKYSIVECARKGYKFK